MRILSDLLQNYGILQASIMYFSIVIITALINQGVTAFRERGKAEQQHRLNIELADKQSEIDSLIKRLESKIRSLEKIDQTRWEIKYQACLQALTIVDGVFSQTEWIVDKKPIKVIKQEFSTREARECMGKLAATCENHEVIHKFADLIIGGANTTNLNEFRNMIREELEFGGEIDLPKDKAWFGYLAGSSDGNQTNEGLGDSDKQKKPSN